MLQLEPAPPNCFLTGRWSLFVSIWKLLSSRACNLQEQLEARLSQKRAEIKSLISKMESLQSKLSQQTEDAELANQRITLTMTQAQQQITG